MPPLPVISGQQAMRVFTRLGWTLKRWRGSHMIMTKPGSIASLSIPDHAELRPGTLRSLIRTAGIDVDDFTRLLKS